MIKCLQYATRIKDGHIEPDTDFWFLRYSGGVLNTNYSDDMKKCVVMLEIKDTDLTEFGAEVAAKNETVKDPKISSTEFKNLKPIYEKIELFKKDVINKVAIK